jgi:hypothetical protein
MVMSTMYPDRAMQKAMLARANGCTCRRQCSRVQKAAHAEGNARAYKWLRMQKAMLARATG